MTLKEMWEMLRDKAACEGLWCPARDLCARYELWQGMKWRSAVTVLREQQRLGTGCPMFEPVAQEATDG